MLVINTVTAATDDGTINMLFGKLIMKKELSIVTCDTKVYVSTT